MDDQQAVTLLRDLCATYSPSTHEEAAVTLLVECANASGLHAHTDDAGNFVAERGFGKRTVLLLGHIDTVPGFIEPRLEGNLLHGRGTVDAKGPLAAFLVAIARASHQNDVRLITIGAVEEEAPTSKGAHYIINKYQPEAVIIGEPSGTSGITLGYKGRVSLALKATQAHAHSAAANRSIAAHAAEFWTRLEDWCNSFNQGKRIFDQVDPHLTKINSQTDHFQDQVNLSGSLRLPLNYSLEDLKSKTTALAGTWGDVTLRHFVEPFKAERRTPLVRSLLREIRKEGLEPIFKLKTGTSDMNVVGPAWQCPIVAYGPGDSRLDHTAEEHISIQDYLKSISILTRVLNGWV